MLQTFTVTLSSSLPTMHEAGCCICLTISLWWNVAILGEHMNTLSICAVNAIFSFKKIAHFTFKRQDIYHFPLISWHYLLGILVLSLTDCSVCLNILSLCLFLKIQILRNIFRDPFFFKKNIVFSSDHISFCGRLPWRTSETYKTGCMVKQI